MRTVQVYKYTREKGETKYKKTDDGQAKFQCFGVNYEELEYGVGNYSAAIIEREDGSVEVVPAEMIKFLD